MITVNPRPDVAAKDGSVAAPAPTAPAQLAPALE